MRSGNNAEKAPDPEDAGNEGENPITDEINVGKDEGIIEYNHGKGDNRKGDDKIEY